MPRWLVARRAVPGLDLRGRVSLYPRADPAPAVSLRDGGGEEIEARRGRARKGGGMDILRYVKIE